MANLTKVTMNLTDADVENAKIIHEATESRSKAQAISIALALTRFLIDIFREHPGASFIVRLEDGSTERVFMPELERARHKAEKATMAG